MSVRRIGWKPCDAKTGKLTPVKCMFLGGRTFPFLYFADAVRSYGVDVAVGGVRGDGVFR